MGINGGKMKLRNYQTEDLPVLARLFYDTVHSVNRRDYTAAQCDAWATGTVDAAQWQSSLTAHRTLVAVEGDEIIGFGDMDDRGYLDRLFVRKDYQRKGVATAICDGLEAGVAAAVFTTHASVTARGFFEQRGYYVVKEQQAERQGIFLTNWLMVKTNLAQQKKQG